MDMSSKTVFSGHGSTDNSVFTVCIHSGYDYVLKTSKDQINQDPRMEERRTHEALGLK